MAIAYGAWVTIGTTRVYRTIIEYSVTANPATTATIQLVTKVEYSDAAGWPSTLGKSATIKATINGDEVTTTATLTPTLGGIQTVATRTHVITKTHSAQTIAVSSSVSVLRNGSVTVTSTASGTQAVSAKTSYAVGYDANGGDASTVPASQVKWHGETLTLSSTVPKRAGCTFLGWATADDGTGDAYAAGGSYTANAAVTLYAVWLGISVPSIACERTDAQGDEADEGTYGEVQASWQAIGTPVATVSVTALNVTSETAITLTGDTTGSKAANDSAYGSVSAIFGAEDGQPGALDIDTRYTIRVTATVSATYGGATRTVTATATAYVPFAYITIDAYAGGHGVAFGKTANREGFDVAMSPLYFSEPPTHDTDLTTAAASSIITENSGTTTIDGAQARRWGKVCQLYINWKCVNAITVPANGNIQNVTVGTIAEGLRPAILTAAHSYGDGAGAAWYWINPQGTVQLGAMEGTGAERTIAAGTIYNLLCTFILP